MRCAFLLLLPAALLAQGGGVPKVSDEALGTQPYEKYERPAGLCHLPRGHRPPARAGHDVPGLHAPLGRDRVLRAGHTPRREGAQGGRRQGRLQRLPRPARLPGRRHPAEAARRTGRAPTSRCRATSATRSPASRATCPHNFNWVTEPGKVKQGPRAGVVEPAPRDAGRTRSCARPTSAAPATTRRTPGACSSSPPTWSGRKAPTARAGSSARTATCRRQPAAAPAWARSCPTCASTSSTAPTTWASSPGWSRCASTPRAARRSPATPSELTAVVVNAKAGHKIPSGSAEERLLWLHVEATDAKGRTYHLPVDRKGFTDEDFTIASEVLAYQDIGDIKGIADFAGLKRDGTYATMKAGDRIFRLPYLDPKGRMTICAVEHRRLRHRLPPGPPAGHERVVHLEAAPGHPPGVGDGDGHRALLASGQLGWRVPEGPCRGVGAGADRRPHHDVHGPRVRRRR